MPHCSKSNDALFICDSTKCRRQNPFVCNQNGCQCNEVSHKECSLISWKKFTQDLNSPERYRNQFKDIIENVQNMIAHSEKMNEILKEEIIKCKSYLAKNQENRNDILKLVQDSEFKKIYKSHIVEYLEFFRVSNQQSKLKDLISKNVKIIKQNQSEIQKYFKQIYEGDTNLINSKIIASVEDVGKFFSEKIKYLKLLYRASDRNFSTDKFHDLCDNIPNTIVIVQTEFDKVFGGFSPSCWGGVGATQDTSQQSFIFSITHDEKMEIIKPKFAIFNCVKVGPVFGGGNSMMADIEICDRANEVRKSGSNFPVNYNNVNQYQSGQVGIQHLTGQKKGRYFFIKEWQVFQVSFESETEVSVEQFLA